MKNLLVIGQVALSMVLLVSTGLFIRSLQATQRVDPGFGDQDAGIISVTLPGTKYSAEEGKVFLQTLTASFQELAGVTEVGFISRLHLDPLNRTWVGLNVDGVDPPPGRTRHHRPAQWRDSRDGDLSHLQSQ